MTKRSIFLIVAALVMAGFYAVYFTDWFKPKIIHIKSANARYMPAARTSRNVTKKPATMPVQFTLADTYKVTDIEVFKLDEWQTNKNCLPVWHLIAETNAEPFDQPLSFYYGNSINGMKPAIPGTKPEQLQPGVKYRLFVQNGSAKGQIDFQPMAPR